MKKISIVLISFILMIMCCGCGLALLAGGIGYAVSASKSADAENSRAEAQLQNSYNEYKLGMEKLNIDREKNHLKPSPIMDIQEWLRVQGISMKHRDELMKYNSSEVYPNKIPESTQSEPQNKEQ